ncbi:tyrosyl-tRNA synthetase, putative [Bodo saltans]|uniref:tyrosine--tRNA ligase n=1 Tax=Bodo saltans TaxID=75058 RepID=A0A0S4JQB1_BODSA|nr:tyrosyl-tRNA synthetase, putative [Bodo saltans]|eukprot:CUG92385.1 tyrosyl-tRNA synthetase, putative [Bodo saltans]
MIDLMVSLQHYCIPRIVIFHFQKKSNLLHNRTVNMRHRLLPVSSTCRHRIRSGSRAGACVSPSSTRGVPPYSLYPTPQLPHKLFVDDLAGAASFSSSVPSTSLFPLRVSSRGSKTPPLLLPSLSSSSNGVIRGSSGVTIRRNAFFHQTATVPSSHIAASVVVVVVTSRRFFSSTASCLSQKKQEGKQPATKTTRSMAAAPTPAAAAAAPLTPEQQAVFDERWGLLRSVGEECISEDDLKNLLLKKPNIRCYDGFEPSGRMHIAQGIFKAINVNKCTSAGCEFVFWVADWFALMNDKVGGELAKIRTVGKYLVEVWNAAGMDMKNVTFLWSSDEINQHAGTYWKTVLDIGRRNSIARIKKCCTIMGKAEGTLTAAQILYPLMQCADIFFLKADICQLGLDQRKVNMLAREYCDLIGRKLKPVILSHHMLSGLKKGQAKMSKSDPDSAIFMEDTREDVERKILNAHCPRVAQEANQTNEDGLGEGSDDKNPVLDYVECILLGSPGSSLTVAGVEYKSYKVLEAAFVDGTVDEASLKRAVIDGINALLEPVRLHFSSNAEAAALLEQVKSFRKGPEAPVAPAAAEEPAAATPNAPCAVAWVPAATKLPLNEAVSIVAALNAFVATGGRAVLVSPDWSAVARDEITGDEKDVVAALAMNVLLIKSYGLDLRVEIVNQSDIILNNRDPYWVTAINVGRKYQLRDVEASLGGAIANAGQVVGCLMRVADAILLNATHVFTSSAFDAKQNELAVAFSNGAIQETVLTTAIPALVDPKAPASAAPLAADDVLYADDTDMDTRRKIKRAYCAPNEAENGVVSVAQWFIGRGISVGITRPEANGGNVSYTSGETVAADALSGALHPGDLKAAVGNALLELTKDARAAASSAEGKKLSTTLRNAEKKLAKKK